MKSKKPKISPKMTTRNYKSRGVNVEIKEAKNHVELKLDGRPISVSIIDGKFHSQIAHMFASFESIDDVVDTLLTNEGRTWTLHGHICNELCRDGKHHHDTGHNHGHDHGH